jgi:hypothetical protein
MSAVLANEEEALATWKKEKIITSEPYIIAWRLLSAFLLLFLFFVIVEKHIW